MEEKRLAAEMQAFRELTGTFQEETTKNGRIVVNTAYGTPWVYVDASRAVEGPGQRGLFAARTFKRLQFLGRYTGKTVGNANQDIGHRLIDSLWRDGKACYIIELDGGRYVDGAQRPVPEEDPYFSKEEAVMWPMPYVHMANDARGSKFKNNIEIDADGFAYAIRNIYKGDEILLDYTDDYWDAHRRMYPGNANAIVEEENDSGEESGITS